MNVAIDGLSKRYGGQVALDGASLAIEQTRCLVFVGPSGGGKSTLLRLLAGLELPDAGSLALNGEPIPDEPAALRQYRQRIGVVFQAYNLFPHLDALENIRLPLEKAHRLAPEKARRKALELLERLQLQDHARKRPSELSGGQNQRVAIARALAPDPDLLLFDEPTSALDPEMTGEVLTVIESLIREGREAILVTHEMGFARQVADHVAFLADGRVADCVPTQAFFDSPQTPAAQRFLSRVLKY